MSLTFANQQSKLSRLLGDSNTGSDDQWPIADRKKELNRGEVQLAIDAKDLMMYATSTVASQLISVPSDWVETYVLVINNVVITNDREISLTDYERWYNWAGTNPYYYFWPDASGNLQLNFISSNVNGQTYKLWYFRKPTTELSGDSDESLHQDEFREGPVYYAAAELLRQIGQNSLADRYQAEYARVVAKADAWARKLYVNKEYARPDFGPMVDQVSTDIQGRGYYA